MVCLAQYKTEATEHALTPRAVAIPALGWRLRVEPTQTRRFETTVTLGTPFGLMDSRRYR
jgi:hypothetical protein